MVRVAILHRSAANGDGSLTATLVAARAALAERHSDMFRASGADEVMIHAGPPDDRSFGERLPALLEDLHATDGLVVLGSGAVPRLRAKLARRFIEAARGPIPRALVNDRYSADIISVARACEALRGLVDLATDNALPRWLSERAGIPVDVLPVADRQRLAFDLDSPLDLVLMGGRLGARLRPEITATVTDRLTRVRAVSRDPAGELLVAGRTSGTMLRVLERGTASRTRAFVEERGLRTARADQRPPAAVIGLLLDREGPASLGAELARLADAAIVDSRVLLAHRHGADERAWPIAEDRFASDMLLPERITDPWLRALTESAVAAPIPVLLGAHTLVGPGLPLALGLRR